jgi:putative ABC transport system permease protein
MLAVPACALGIGLGMAAQEGLVQVLGSLVPQRLPLPEAMPALTGAGIGLLLLFGFGLPPLLRLRGVPPMRVLNRSFAALPPASLLAYVAALAASCCWRCRSPAT